MHFPPARCTIQKKSSAFCQGGQTFWYEEELFLCCRRQLTIFSWPRPSKLTYIVHNSQSQGTQKLNCRLITRFHHHFTLRAFKALHWLALLFFFQGTICQIFFALHWYLVKNWVTCIKKGDWTIWPIQFNVRQKQ